ncbi:hypothetical protein [Streptomyces decoyicus]|uniref:hypothetical protein n=1 Tax=Streptomyces decoyicus TaxID=249567 RepID=UPI00386DC888
MHPDTFETIVLSHGHLNHVTGLRGLVRRLGPPGPARPACRYCCTSTCGGAGSPVLAPRLDLPTPSRGALEQAGFTVLEDRRPSLLLDDFLLITGEVERSTGFETACPATRLAPTGNGRRTSSSRTTRPSYSTMGSRTCARHLLYTGRVPQADAGRPPTPHRSDWTETMSR